MLCQSGQTTSLLLTAGASVNTQNNDGDSALRTALSNKKITAIMKLLNGGADTTAKYSTWKSVQCVLKELGMKET